MNARHVVPLTVLGFGCAMIVVGSLPGVSIVCAICGAFVAGFGAFLVLVS